MVRRRLLWMAAAAALWLTGDAMAQRIPAQAARVKDLAAGKLLVADRSLGDPNFAETVVLLVNYGADGAMGLILSRRTKIPISRVLEEMEEAKGMSDPVYLGGPVSRTGVLALLRSRTKPEEARHVAGDVYLISSKTLLEKTLQARPSSGAFRVYLGYAGWAEGQLQHEVALGAWHVFPSTTHTVFDPDPESLWSRLIDETEKLIAQLYRLQLLL